MKFLLACFLLVGCAGSRNKLEAAINSYTKICVDRVTYIQFVTGTVVQVDLDGRPIRCDP